MNDKKKTQIKIHVCLIPLLFKPFNFPSVISWTTQYFFLETEKIDNTVSFLDFVSLIHYKR